MKNLNAVILSLVVGLITATAFVWGHNNGVRAAETDLVDACLINKGTVIASSRSVLSCEVHVLNGVVRQ